MSRRECRPSSLIKEVCLHAGAELLGCEGKTGGGKESPQAAIGPAIGPLGSLLIWIENRKQGSGFGWKGFGTARRYMPTIQLHLDCHVTHVDTIPS